MSAAANSMDKHSGYFTQGLEAADPEVFNSVQDELNRQRDKIELIASENIVSKAVLEAQGSVLTNKYAEGYPGKRYYGGCEYVDVAEQLAIERACKLFGAAFANVQPHSGANANQAVFYALLNPGDTFMAIPPTIPANGSSRCLTPCAATTSASTWIRSPPWRASISPS